MRLSKLSIIFIVIFLSCNSNKKKSNTILAENNVKKMITQGYTFGIIEKSDLEGDCKYSIKVSDKVFYDPINLDDSYKTTVNIEIWFKFNRLRMMNRCDKALPIKLTKIIKK